MKTMAELIAGLPPKPHDRIADLHAAAFPNEDGYLIVVTAKVDGEQTSADFRAGLPSDVADSRADTVQKVIEAGLHRAAVDSLLTQKRVRDLMPTGGKQWMYEDGELVEF